MVRVSDRYAVLIFAVGESTDDAVADEVVADLVAPSDWRFESASVVTGPAAFRRLDADLWGDSPRLTDYDGARALMAAMTGDLDRMRQLLGDIPGALRPALAAACRQLAEAAAGG